MKKWDQKLNRLGPGAPLAVSDTGDSTSPGLSLIDALNPETKPRDNTTAVIELARERKWRNERL